MISVHVCKLNEFPIPSTGSKFNTRLGPGGPRDARGRARRSEKFYRVRWLGHSPTEDTWEPRRRLLEDVPDVVNDYEASLAAASVSTVAANDYDPESDFDCVNAGVDAIPRGELCCVSPLAPAATAIGRSAPLPTTLPRSVARAPADAPIQRASVDPQSQSSSHSLPQGARSRFATRAVPAGTRALAARQWRGCSCCSRGLRART
ncbi:unnamed protein product [Phytophthora lilii]|uniref:Unnamed protein product n=1 Tax=Phytophthora lilii TaxID=2077276 RepID=A0A9W6X816_9STRA|nr:unnamed protein product [Phytophthora lilii]